MNDRIIDVLIDMRDRYGDMIFYNQHKTKNLLHDLAPGLQKERIHICQFLELNGYFQLKYAGHSYPIIRSRLIQAYVNTYAVNEKVALWVLDIFSELLGFSDFDGIGEILETEAPPPLPPPPTSPPPEQPKPKQTKSSTGTFRGLGTSPQRGGGAAPHGLKTSSTFKNPRPFDANERVAADVHSLGIMNDGHVRAVGVNDEGQCEVDGWRGIRAVAAGPGFSVGLREDGRVLAAGRNEYGQCNVSSWRNIVAISAGARHTIGLTIDGRVLAAGQNRNGECRVEGWRNIVEISAGYLCTFGIKKDYKVLTKGNIQETKVSVGALSDVKDVLNPYPYRALALKRNGRLVALGQDGEGGAGDKLQKSLAKWRTVKHVSAGPDYFAGLMEDGTVRILAYYWVPSGIECNPDDWSDIIAIAAGRFHLLAVRRDGRVIAEMMHPSDSMNKGQCRVRDWRIV